MLFPLKIVSQSTSSSPLIKLTLITPRETKNLMLQQRDGILNVFALAFICHSAFSSCEYLPRFATVSTIGNHICGMSLSIFFSTYIRTSKNEIGTALYNSTFLYAWTIYSFLLRAKLLILWNMWPTCITINTGSYLQQLSHVELIFFWNLQYNSNMHMWITE